MSDHWDKPANLRQLQKLLGGLCNGTLADDEREQLEKRLANDEKALNYYLDYVMVHVRLGSVAMLDLCDDDPVGCSESPSAEPQVDQGPSGRSTLRSNASRYKDHPTQIQRVLAWMLPLAASVGLALAYVGLKQHSDDRDLSADAGHHQAGTDPADSTSIATESALPLYVAQISGVTADVRWGNESSYREFLLRVRRGDRLELQSGLVELDYYSGAKIILHGPCVYVPTAASSGRLISGQLTGLVKDGDFTLTTPTARVIDLGTEFGVALDESNGTDVCVFDGQVRVLSTVEGSSMEGSQLLEKGMAVRIGRSQGILPLTDSKPERFVRELPVNTQLENEISLVNLLSGLNRGRYRLAGVIAPDTGESDRQPWLRADGPGYSVSKGFQETSWHPFVDGVFIPSSKGTETQIDSIGHVVDLPSCTGRTWGPIWSRSRVTGASAAESQEDYWGAGSLEEVVDRIETCRTGMIGAHSNVGLTFDLDAIRHHSGKLPTELIATISNLNNSLKRKPKWAQLWRFSADFRVLVDGELRSSRIDFAREDGELSISVSLADADRFLTLVTTDAGKDEPHAHTSNDHVVIIDPVLKLTD